MCTSRCGSLNGSPRRNRSLIKLKIAVFSPMPSASVMTARKVNPGDLPNCRKAKRRSLITIESLAYDFAITSLVSQCDHGIDLSGPACGNETRCGGDKSKHSCHRAIDNWIERVDLEENVLQRSGGENSEKQCGATGAKDKSYTQLPCALGHDHAKDASGIRAQRHTDAEFLRPLSNGKAHHAVKTNGREHECDRSENAEQGRDNAVAAENFIVQPQRRSGEISW